MLKNYKLTVRVYNTITKHYELVEVSKEVKTEYRRGQWKIENNDESFYSHEIQMSGLIGGEDGANDNFREFVNSDNTPETEVIKNFEKSDLHIAISQLTEQEQNLIIALFFNNLSESEYAALTGVSRQMVNKKKHRILKKLKNFLK